MQQAFLVCRHAGVLLTTVVIARWLPVDKVAGIEKLLLCGYILTFFWNDAFLRSLLSIQPTEKEKSRFLWIVFTMVGLTMMVLYFLSPWILPALTGVKELEGLMWFCLYQTFILPFWIAPFISGFNRFQLGICSVFALIGPLAATIVGFNQLHSPTGILLGWASYGITSFFLIGFLGAIKPTFRIYSLIARLWKSAWPLFLFALSAGLAKAFDSWWIGQMSSDSQFTIFRYGARDFPWATALTGALSITLIPKLINDDAIQELKLRSTRLLHIIILPAMILMIWSPILFKWIYGDAYMPSAIIFNIYLLIALTQVVFPQSILVARNESKLLWYVSMFELVINVIITIILFQFLDIYGVAIGTLLAFAIEKWVLLYFVNKKFNIPAKSLIQTNLWLRYTILMLILFLFATWYPTILGN